MSLFAQLADALNLCSRPEVPSSATSLTIHSSAHARAVRTAADEPMEPEKALRLLQAL